MPELLQLKLSPEPQILHSSVALLQLHAVNTGPCLRSLINYGVGSGLCRSISIELNKPQRTLYLMIHFTSPTVIRFRTPFRLVCC